MAKETLKKWSKFVCPHALFSIARSDNMFVYCASGESIENVPDNMKNTQWNAVRKVNLASVTTYI